MKDKKMLGFTLLELMVVIAIIGVLAVIAMPMYSDYARKARRSDAKIALTSIAQAQETYHADYPRYASVIAAATVYDKTGMTYTLGCRTACKYDTATTKAYSPDGHYELTILRPDNGIFATGFKLTAVAKNPGPQATDTDCLAFALNSLGTKASGGSASAAEANLIAADPDPKDCW